MKKLSFKRKKNPYIHSDGHELPGVTTVLQTFPKPELIAWAHKQGREGNSLADIREEATSIGSIAHFIIEATLKGDDFVIDNEFPAAWRQTGAECAENFMHWWKQEQLTMVESELQIIDHDTGFGGTIDIVASRPGWKGIIDFKSSSGVWKDYYAQVAAYRWLYHEHCGEWVDAVIVRAGKDDSFDDVWLSPTQLDAGEDAFFAAFNFYNAIKSLDNSIPKSYRRKKAA